MPVLRRFAGGFDIEGAFAAAAADAPPEPCMDDEAVVRFDADGRGAESGTASRTRESSPKSSDARDESGESGESGGGAMLGG